MSNVANKYRKGPNQRPDLAQETRELRRMAQERDEEIERLRDALKEAYRLTDTFCRDMTDEAFQELEQHFINALNGGGGDDDE